MSDLLPYTHLGLLGVRALLGPAGRGAGTRASEFSVCRLTERRP